MKTTLLAAIAVLGVALAAPAFAATDRSHATEGNSQSYITRGSDSVGARSHLAATDSEGNGGSNPYATPMTGRGTHDQSSTHPIA
jgi:hypothetical protein